MQHEIPEPWKSFLSDLDEQLDREVSLHCHGGFVVAMCYGFKRPTGDIDFLKVVPYDAINQAIDAAGKGSVLHTKHGVYLDHFGMNDHPDSYADRLIEMFPARFRYLRLWALDPYDLALSKLCRNLPKDREDVRYLAERVPLDLETLRTRYESEMRPYLANPDREDLTLQLWIDDIEELRTRGR
jgi:uncharacterized nucleotidyltransferase DUF6036